MSDGARYLSEINNVNFNYAKQSLWRALNGYLKSYKDYIWQYIQYNGHLCWNWQTRRTFSLVNIKGELYIGNNINGDG